MRVLRIILLLIFIPTILRAQDDTIEGFEEIENYEEEKNEEQIYEILENDLPMIEEEGSEEESVNLYE